MLGRICLMSLSIIFCGLGNDYCLSSSFAIFDHSFLLDCSHIRLPGRRRQCQEYRHEHHISLCRVRLHASLIAFRTQYSHALAYTAFSASSYSPKRINLVTKNCATWDPKKPRYWFRSVLAKNLGFGSGR